MAKSTITMGILVDEQTTISFTQVCENQGIPETVLMDLLEHGLLPEVVCPTKQMNFDVTMIHRIQSAYHLLSDLGINTPGVVLALELMDKLNQMSHELIVLQRHVKVHI